MANATLTNCLKAILSFLSSFSLGPIAIAFFAVLITIIHQVRHKNLETSTSNPDYSSVDDWYGPGNYYGWLITALAAVCQSNPERPEIVNPVHPNLANVPAANANAGNANLPADEGIISQLQSKIWALDAAAVAAAVAYPSVAAIDMLIRIYRKDFGHQFQAADRTVQVGWIFATFYLLHHIFGGGGVVYGRPRTPSLTTVLWTGLWTLITVAMSADNVVRDRLGSTALKVFTPFCVCIPFPMGVVALWRWRIRNHAVPAALVVGGNPAPVIVPAAQEGWHFTVLNVSTLILCIAYVLCPDHYKYDPESPQAPKTGSKITDMGQAAALAVAIVCALPSLAMKAWNVCKNWFRRVR